MKRRGPLLGGVLVLAALGPWAGANAQNTAGRIDPSFGHLGMATAVSGANSVGAARLQPDGKIVVVAPVSTPSLATLACGIVRFLPNGALDRSFGNRGVVLTAPFSNFINSPSDLAIQPDGKIVVVGGGQSADGSVNPAFVLRLNPDGSLDNTFGNRGVTITSFAKFDVPGVVLVQPDGKIVIGGYALPANDEQPTQTILARYTAAGVLDPAFGQGGKVQGLTGAITALALQADGRILTNDGAPFVRVLANGAVDATNAGGIVTVSAHTGVGAFLPSGKFVLAAATTEFGDRHDVDLLMTRLSQSGANDPTFVSPEIDFGPEGPHAISYTAAGVAVQSDGKLLAAVPVNVNQMEDFAIARFNPDGAIDGTFGTAGQVLTSFPTGNGALIYTLLVQPDQKIVAVGLALPFMKPPQLEMVRYLGQ